MRRNKKAGEDVEFRVFTSGSCDEPGSTAQDMYGMSPYGRVKDILHSHGLCGHRNWYAIVFE